MEPKKEIKRIRNLIAHGELEKAIDALRSIVSLREDTSLVNEIVLHNRRYNELLKSLRLGLITSTEKNLEYAKIAHAVLELLDIVEKTLSIDNQKESIAKSEKQIDRVIQSHFGTGDNVAGDKISAEKKYNLREEYKLSRIYPKFLSILPTIDSKQVIGRDNDVNNLKKILDSVNRLVFLTGPAGTGKTTIAKQFVTKYESHYDHILWLNFQNGENNVLLSEILLTNLNISKKGSPKSALKEVLVRLDRLGNQCLIIIDDFDGEIISVRDFLPSSPHWHILILSRQQTIFHDAYQYVLQPLSPKESLELFYANYDKSKNDLIVKRIIEAVEYHPLTIQLIAQTAENSGLSLDLVFSILQERGVGFVETGGEKTTELTSLLLGFFEVSKLSKEEKLLLKNFFLIPEGTSLNNQVEYLNRQNRNFFTSHELDELLSGLEIKGWITRSDSEQLFFAHKLLLEVLANKLSPRLDEVRDWIETIIQELHIDQSKDNPVDKFKWIPFGERILEVFSQESDPLISTLQNELSLVYKANGEYLKAINLLGQSIKIDIGHFGEESLEVAKKQSDLATLYQDIGEFQKAINLAQKALATDSKLQGEESESVAVRRSNLAVLYLDIKEYKKAETLLEKALATDTALYGDDNPITAITLSNLALVYRRQGRLDDALDVYVRTLEILKKNFEEEHPNVSTVKTNIAKVYLAIGNIPDAKKLLQESLKADLNNFGKNHPETATTYSNIASVYEIEGNFEKASHYLKVAIESDTKNFGENHQRVALKKSSLAKVFQKSGNYEEARSLLDAALEVNIKIFGDNTPETANSITNLALNNKSLGYFDEAIGLLIKAGEIYRKNFGPNHPQVLDSDYQIALLYFEIGDYITARHHFEIILKDISTTSISTSQTIYLIQSNLAFIYRAQNELDKAFNLYKSLLEDFEEKYGEEDPRTQEIRSELALVYEKQGKKAEAEKLWNSTLKPVNEAKVIFIGESNYGKTHLIEMLQNGEISREIKTTHGIERTSFPISYEESEIQLNFWDLGGQDFMHTTHQFFFTKRALYVLVTLARKERRELKYWLDLVDKLGDSAPVLVVIHQVDVNEHDIDRASLQREYENIVGFVRTTIYDCDEISAVDSIQNLKTKIINAVADETLMPGVFQKQRPGFFAVKEAVQEIERDFITFQEFENLEYVQYLSADEKKNYLRLLSILGTVVSFVDDVRLIDTNVIKPQWILDGIYRIINDPKIKNNNYGEFHVDELLKILNQEKFPIHRHGYLLGLMEKFLLCFPLNPEKTSFLLPDLLTDVEPDIKWDNKDIKRFRYRYTDFEPRSIITQFIVYMHNDIKENKVWRSGVFLSNGECEARVYSVFRDSLVYIDLQGKQKERLRYRYVIENAFEKIHAYYPKVKPQQEICYNHTTGEIWLNYEDVIIHREYEKDLFNTAIKESIPLDSLLDEFPPSKSVTKKLKEGESNTSNTSFHVNVYGGTALVGNKKVKTSESNQEDQGKKQISKKNWWAIRLIIAFIVGLVLAYFSNKYIGINFYDTWLASSVIIGLFLLARNPNRRFQRAAYFVLGLLGGVNLLPQFDILINSKTETAEKANEWFFQLGVQDEPMISIGLLVLAGFLFYLDSKEG